MIYIRCIKFVVTSHARKVAQSHDSDYACDLTCDGQHMQGSHDAEMLKSEISELRTPSQEQSVQSDHRGDVTDADIRNVRASTRTRKIRLKKFALLRIKISLSIVKRATRRTQIFWPDCRLAKSIGKFSGFVAS